MPVVRASSYRPPWWLTGAHAQTIWPTVVRRIPGLKWERERLELPDGDFLDLDWSRVGGRRLAVVAHGLEGHAKRPYVAGLVRALNRRGWDALAWNFRGCSGEPNRLMRSYHSGATEDLASVVTHARGRDYAAIVVAGFSLGGNLTLKFLGEGNPAAAGVAAGAVISVPCDLRAAAVHMARPHCVIYMRRFLRDMEARMQVKRAQFGEVFPAVNGRALRTFAEFDDAFTAPLHGFASAEDYWARCSAVRFIDGLRVPVLMLNALDDPFLARECFPFAEAEQSPQLTLEAPRRGGHVGFVGRGAYPGEYWSEQRICEFLNDASA